MKVKITKVPALFKGGGDINIKPSHRGLFTLKANRHGMGVLLFASHVLANKEGYPTSTIRLANFARNASKWNALGGNLLYANGGLFDGLHTHGIDFIEQGDFTEFNTGSSHEMNGNEGIPQGVDNNGTPNLVEQGETKWNDYIFSNRLTIPTKKELDKELKSLPENEGGDSQRGWEISILKKWAGKTYAYASKHAYKEAEERSNDLYSNETLDEILGVLKNSQEKLRAIENSKKEAKEELDLLKEMSDKDYADAKELQELQLKAQQQTEMQLALLLQALAELQALMEQLMALMTPEEQQAYIQLMQLQQAMLQLQMSLQGYAEGGLLSDEQVTLQLLIAASYYQYLQQTKDSNKMLALLLRIQLYSLLIKQLPQELLQAAALQMLLQALYEAAMLDLDFINQLQLAYLLFAEGGDLESQVTDAPLMEEAPHDELTGINPTQDVEEMSTSLLNETIDLIYQWAKLNGNKLLARRARRAKKVSREEKEDFVDEALEEVEQLRVLLLELLRVEELQALELMTLEALMLQELLMSQEELSEAMAALELNALMLLPLLFANGGNLFPYGGVTTTTPLVGNKIGSTTRTIGNAITNHDRLFGTNIKNWVDALLDIINTELDDTKKLLLKLDFINTWNNINDAYSNMNSTQNPNAVKKLQTLFDDAGLNKGIDISDLKILKANTNTPYTSDISIDNTLGEITANRYLSADPYRDEFAKIGITYNPYDATNANFFHKLSLSDELAPAVTNATDIKTPSEKDTPVSTTLKEAKRYILPDGTYFDSSKLDDALQRLYNASPEEYFKDKYNIIKGEVTTEEDTNYTNYLLKTIKDNNAPIPRYDNTGDKIALGLNAFSLLHNLASPADTYVSDSMREIIPRMSLYMTTMPTFLGDYVSPRRFDRNYWNNIAQANAALQIAGINNSSAGNRAMANALILGANLNYINTLGQLAKQGELFNADRELQEATFNRGTNQFNAEQALKASMANQDAFNRSLQRFGEYYTRGITAAESARQAKEAAINNALSNLAKGINTLYLNKWLNQLLGWRGEYVNPIGGLYDSGYTYDPIKGIYVKTKN